MLFSDVTLEAVYCVFRFFMISLGHVADFILNLCIYMGVYCIFWEESKHLTSLVIIPCNVENMEENVTQTGEATMNCTIVQNAKPYEFCFFLLLQLVSLLTVSIKMVKLGLAQSFLLPFHHFPTIMLMFVGQQKAGTMYYIL